MHMGAVQAQDYAGSKWAVGLRLPGSTDAAIEQAFAGKEIVRTWALRGTLHLVAACDLRWLLGLVGPVVIRKNARRYRELGLDDHTLARSSRVIREALQDGNALDRPSLRAILEDRGILTGGQRYVYMLQRASLEGLIVQRGMCGNAPVFASPGPYPPGRELKDRSDALRELARRYFTSHGPATLKDFTWWSGLPASDARAGLEAAAPGLIRTELDNLSFIGPGNTASAEEEPPAMHLLPAYDEFLVGYKDRSAMAGHGKWRSLVLKNGIITPTIVIDGHIAGTWKKTVKNGSVRIVPTPFTPFRRGEAEAFSAAAQRYAEFLGITAG